jgi:hypothetical protein
MPMVKECLEPGCETLTMGPYCIDHEQPRVVGHSRGTASRQNSVGRRGGGSIPPAAETPAASSSARKIAALRGA